MTEIPQDTTSQIQNNPNNSKTTAKEPIKTKFMCGLQQRMFTENAT